MTDTTTTETPVDIPEPDITPADLVDPELDPANFHGPTFGLSDKGRARPKAESITFKIIGTREDGTPEEFLFRFKGKVPRINAVVATQDFFKDGL